MDLDTDPDARQAYFERLWAYAGTLEPTHNSPKANVLYNRLRHDLTQGVFDGPVWRSISNYAAPGADPALEPATASRTPTSSPGSIRISI